MVKDDHPCLKTLKEGDWVVCEFIRYPSLRWRPLPLYSYNNVVGTKIPVVIVGFDISGSVSTAPRGLPVIGFPRHVNVDNFWVPSSMGIDISDDFRCYCLIPRDIMYHRIIRKEAFDLARYEKLCTKLGLGL